MPRLRLTHPALDFWVDVRVREFDGRWLAVADLAGEPEMGLGAGPGEALSAALAPFDSLSLHEGALTIPGYSMDGWYGRICSGCGFSQGTNPR